VHEALSPDQVKVRMSRPSARRKGTEYRIVTKSIVIIVLSCAAPLFAQDASRSTPTRTLWKPLEFLIGTWEARTEGGSAGAASLGTYTFQLELRDHVLARHSSTAGCQGPADFNCEHGDLLYVFQETPGRSFKAIYFDNEGHIIHYEVSTPTPTSAIFLSSPSQPGPQFKLSYELKGSILYGKFQIRMPGQAEFNSYLEWDGGKR
jgi:hypothetical protein